MPNWVRHSLTITGPELDRRSFLNECFSGEGKEWTLDFNRIVPEPVHFEAVDPPLPEATITKRPDGAVAIELHEEPRFPAWYEWRCRNWGDKWNACDCSVEKKADEILLCFSTAWAVPVPILETLARRYPRLTIEGTALEGMLNWEATIACRNGETSITFDKTDYMRALDEEQAEA
jgi:hypothetical protein